MEDMVRAVDKNGKQCDGIVVSSEGRRIVAGLALGRGECYNVGGPIICTTRDPLFSLAAGSGFCDSNGASIT